MNLSLYETKILTLITLLETQPELFTQDDKTSLLYLIDTVPNDKEEISNQIVTWYQNRPNIKAKLTVDSGEPVVMAIGGRGIPVTAEEYKEIIKNAIREPSEEKTKLQNKSPKP